MNELERSKALEQKAARWIEVFNRGGFSFEPDNTDLLDEDIQDNRHED